MDFDADRAIEFILSGEFEQEKANQQQSNTSTLRKSLNSMKQYYTRSKSPHKNRKASPSNATAEVINVSDDDYEDAQLRLAVEMSLQESAASSPRRTPNHLESRPAGKSPYFGPARGTDYDEASWGMVLPSSSGQETGLVDSQGNSWLSRSSEIEDVAAAEREKIESQPTVLDTRVTNPGWGIDAVSSTAGLMTILHKVPKAREAFLLASPRDPGTEDGPGEGWWKGSQSPANGAVGEDIDATGEAVLREAARIMAFLDDTERAYGRYVCLCMILTIDSPST
jgi:hypothetical protein